MSEPDFIPERSTTRRRRSAKPTPSDKKILNPTQWIAVLSIAFLCLIAGAAWIMKKYGSKELSSLLPILDYERNESVQTQLKQIGMALHQYHDASSSFPYQTIGDQGQTLHSWQTSLLSYMGKGEIANRIDWSTGWQSSSNRPLLSQPVESYLIQGNSTAAIDGYAVSHLAGSSHILRDRFTIHRCTDGTSNTIMAGEVRKGFRPWADPMALRNPGDGIGAADNLFGDQHSAIFLMMDGAVRNISAQVDPLILRAMATPAGDERFDTLLKDPKKKLSLIIDGTMMTGDGEVMLIREGDSGTAKKVVEIRQEQNLPIGISAWKPIETKFDLTGEGFVVREGDRIIRHTVDFRRALLTIQAEYGPETPGNPLGLILVNDGDFRMRVRLVTPEVAKSLPKPPQTHRAPRMEVLMDLGYGQKPLNISTDFFWELRRSHEMKLQIQNHGQATLKATIECKGPYKSDPPGPIDVAPGETAFATLKLSVPWNDRDLFQGSFLIKSQNPLDNVYKIRVN